MAPKRPKRAAVVKTLASRRSKRTKRPVERYGFPSTPPSTPRRSPPGGGRRPTKSPATPKKKKGTPKMGTPPSTHSKKVTRKPKTPAAPNDKSKFAPSTSASPSPGTPPQRKSSSDKAVTASSSSINGLGKSRSPTIKVEPTRSPRRNPPAGTLFFGKPIGEAYKKKSPPVKKEKKSPTNERKSNSPGLFVSPKSSSSAELGFPAPEVASWEYDRHHRYFQDVENHRNLDDEGSYWHRTFQEEGNVDAAWTAWCRRYVLAQCGCPSELLDQIKGGKHSVTGYDRFQTCSNPSMKWHQRFTDIYKNYSYLDRKKYCDE